MAIIRCSIQYLLVAYVFDIWSFVSVIRPLPYLASLLFPLVNTSFFSVSVSHRLPHPPRMPSNIELVSGPVIEAVLTLIWSYSCLFLPLMSASASASAFYFAGHLIVLLHIP